MLIPSVSFNLNRMLLPAHRLEVGAGRIEGARRAVLRAVRECPSYKALWLEGLQGLKGVSDGVKRDESGCFTL